MELQHHQWSNFCTTIPLAKYKWTEDFVSIFEGREKKCTTVWTSYQYHGQTSQMQSLILFR